MSLRCTTASASTPPWRLSADGAPNRVTVTAEELSFEWNGLTLAGTLHTPATASDAQPGVDPVPAVLMMQGSGPADRDSGGYFPPIRDNFNRRGIATFSFDKPGCGQSTGDWMHYALYGRADQADAALDVLRDHPAVNAEALGIFGHSQGGWLTQILAARRNDVAFAVSSSGPSITVNEQNLFGCEHTMRAAGHDQTEIDEALRFIGQVTEAAAAEQDYASVSEQLISPAQDRPWYGYLAIDDTAEWDFAKLLVSEDHDPCAELAKVSCPYLAVFGGLDVLVPAWSGAQESGHALCDAPSDDTTVVVFPGGDHRMQDDGVFVPGYLDLLGDWTAARADSSR